MTGQTLDRAIIALRWTLGVVIAAESVITAWTAYPEIHATGSHAAAHAWIRLMLGGLEGVGAIMLLIPWSALIGGWILIAVFSLAILFHAMQGQFNMGNLVIYAAGTVVCMVRLQISKFEDSRAR